MRVTGRELVASFAVAVVLYAIAVLEFVAVSPDLRVRALLVDPPAGGEAGIVVRDTPGLVAKPGQIPVGPGDMVVSVGRRPTPTLFDFFEANGELYRISERQISLASPDAEPEALSSEGGTGWKASPLRLRSTRAEGGTWMRQPLGVRSAKR